MNNDTATTLRARVLYFYARHALREQQAATLSPASLAKLLALDEPDPRKRDVQHVIDALDGKLDARWEAGRLVLRMPADDSNHDADVRAVLAHWKRVTKRPGTLDTAQRKRHVLARLREGYTVEQLCASASAMAASPFHCGDNDRGARYLDVSHFARSAEVLDRWLEQSPQGQRNAASDRVAAARREAQQRRRRRKQ